MTKLMALALVFSVSVSAFAAEITPEKLKARADIVEGIKGCPRPFSGSGNFLAQRMNTEVVTKVGTHGKEPPEKEREAIFTAFLRALDAKLMMPPDAGMPHQNYRQMLDALAGKGKMPAKKPFRVDTKVWGDFAVLWFREPSEPAVHLLVKEAGKWNYLCITEYIYNEVFE